MCTIINNVTNFFGFAKDDKENVIETTNAINQLKIFISKPPFLINYYNIVLR